MTFLKMGGFKITAEIPLFLTYFSFMLVGSLLMNLYMYKTCYNLMGYPEANCSRLGKYTDNETQALEQLVQPQAAYVTTIGEMVPGSIPVPLSLMVGSWSDKYGRKPVMMYVLVCLTMGFTISSIILLFKELNPYLLMLPTIPVATCGGSLTFSSVTLAYLNDISTAETKGIRNALFEGILVFTVCFGSLISSPLLYATSYSAVYAIGAVLVAIAALYTYFCLPESLNNKSNEKRAYLKVFTCQNLSGMFLVIGKKRPFNRRSIIVILISIMLIFFFANTGEANIKTLYVRKILAWTLTDKNVFTSWSSVVAIVVTIGLTYLFQQKLKIQETLIILVAIISNVGGNILYAMAKNNWYIYGSVPVGILGGLLNPMLRTKIATCLPANEMGKIFSLITVVNSLSSLVAGLLYSFIYGKTINTHPETFNWVSVGFIEFCMVLIIVVMVIEHRQPPEANTILSEKEHEQNGERRKSQEKY